LDAAMDDLARHLDTLRDSEVQALVPARAHALLHLFPVLAKIPALHSAPAPSVLPDAIELRQQGSAALRELFAAIGRSRPLVLWLDDVQWGDLDSAPLLEELLRDAPGSPAPPLLLLLTYRSDEQRGSPLIRRLIERRDVGGSPPRTIE